MGDYMGLGEAADRLDVCTKTVRRWIDTGALPAYRIGPRTIRIRTSDVDALLTPLSVATGEAKPPRIPEPGLWGVVEASAHDSARFEWVRHPEGWTATTMTPQQWSDLIDPVLIREGVES